MKKFLLVASVLFGIMGTRLAFSMAVDNPFLGTFIDRKLLLAGPDHRETSLFAMPFMILADHSFNQYGENAPLFGYGDQPYHLTELDNALLATGAIKNPLIKSEWRGTLSSGPYAMAGMFKAYGCAFGAYVQNNEYFGIGARWSLMQMRSACALRRSEKGFDNVLHGPGDYCELQQLQEKINNALGIEPALWRRFTVGDVEIFGRLSTRRDYEYLCHYLDAGVALGVVVPTGCKRDINNPASVSGGGDGYWGVFFEANLDAILKPDLRVEFVVRMQQRFARVGQYRMPALNEPIRYGAIVGDASVDPGLTIACTPQVVFEAIRGGLGARLGYSLVKHFGDHWGDMRFEREVLINTDSLFTNSEWGAEHVTCGLLYDFGRVMSASRWGPVVSLNVDFPVSFTVGERSAKTYGITVGIEAHF